MRWTDVDGDYIDCTDGVWTARCGRHAQDISVGRLEAYPHSAMFLRVHSVRSYCGVVGPLTMVEARDALSLWEISQATSPEVSKYSPKAEKLDPRDLSFDLRRRLQALDLSGPDAVDSIWWKLSSPELSLPLHRVLVAGAAQYGAESWHTAPDAVNMYTAAMLRHYLWEIYYPGSDGIDESGHPHDAHALANCVILTDLMKG